MCSTDCVTGSQSGNCFLTPSWCCDHKKELAITAIALIAITALVIGILALLSTSYTNLNGLNALGTPGGASLVSIGGLALLLALVSAYYIRKNYYENFEHQGRFTFNHLHQSTVMGNGDKIETIKNEGVEKYLENGIEVQNVTTRRKLIHYKTFPPLFLNAVNEVLKELKISDLKDCLKQNYHKHLEELPDIELPFKQNIPQMEDWNYAASNKKLHKIPPLE
ncbi:MAG TPA: hypothetical protein VIH61_05610 [Waddliaceae bacterium]